MRVASLIVLAVLVLGCLSVALGRPHGHSKEDRAPFQSSKRKLVIDTDPGIDDTAALLTVFGSALFDVLGVTTVFGNTDTDHTTQNALNLLSLMHAENVPVYRGAVDPWSDPRLPFPVQIHGVTGLGNVSLPDSGRMEEDISAAEFIVRVVNQFPGEVDLLFVGPLTNLANAIQLDPDLPSKWARVAIMGGAFLVEGNINGTAEANFMNDPVAAEFVFKRGKNLYVVPLDVTLQCPFTQADLDELSEGNPNSRLLSEMYQIYLDFYIARDPTVTGAPPHDAIAYLALIAPELFEWHSGTVHVTTCGELRGKSILQEEPSDDRSVNLVALSGDSDAILHQIKHFITHPVTEV